MSAPTSCSNHSQCGWISSGPSPLEFWVPARTDLLWWFPSWWKRFSLGLISISHAATHAHCLPSLLCALFWVPCTCPWGGWGSRTTQLLVCFSGSVLAQQTSQGWVEIPLLQLVGARGCLWQDRKWGAETKVLVLNSPFQWVRGWQKSIYKEQLALPHLLFAGRAWRCVQREIMGSNLKGGRGQKSSFSPPLNLLIDNGWSRSWYRREGKEEAGEVEPSLSALCLPVSAQSIQNEGPSVLPSFPYPPVLLCSFSNSRLEPSLLPATDSGTEEMKINSRQVKWMRLGECRQQSRLRGS